MEVQHQKGDLLLIPSAVQLGAGLAVGLIGGVLSGLFGVGGGIVLIPLLHLGLGLNQHQAQGVTLAALLLPNGLPAMIQYRRSGVPFRVDLVWALILAFLPGIWIGAHTANRIPEVPLRWAFVGLLILLAIRTFLQKPDEPFARPADLNTPIWVPGLVIGLAGGFFAGLFGLGGGVVMIPLLGLWLRLPQHQAQMTSLAVLLLPIGLPGLWVYAHQQPYFPWFVLGGLALGFLLGTYFGARLAIRVSGPHLRKLFAGLMVLLAGMMLW